MIHCVTDLNQKKFGDTPKILGDILFKWRKWAFSFVIPKMFHSSWTIYWKPLVWTLNRNLFHSELSKEITNAWITGKEEVWGIFYESSKFLAWKDSFHFTNQESFQLTCWFFREKHRKLDDYSKRIHSVMNYWWDACMMCAKIRIKRKILRKFKLNGSFSGLKFRKIRWCWLNMD